MSDLHDRLAHLVNYSSQLIFVSGESINDQQRTLNTFLSSQHENTEISFFSASKNQQVIDYRSAICRQLGGHVVGSFVRPLAVLLNDPSTGLDPHNGPYLLCISQAEHLSPEFLQELWDWVMHSQQGQHKIHLNVILFGESTWAKQSQQWLPSQNSHKPVLLSSASVDPVGFDVNALEALMADKHSWFSMSNQPIVTNKWFIGSVLSIFLFIFIGLMAWQYPSQVEALIMGAPVTTDSTILSTATQKAKTGSDTTNDRTSEISVDSKAQIADLDYTRRLEVIPPETPLLNESLTAKEASSEGTANDLLVSNWPSKFSNVSRMENDSLIESPAINQLTSQSIDSAFKHNNASSLQQQTTPAKPNNYVSSASRDFQVPDIISVEQLDAKLSINQATSLETHDLDTYLESADDSLLVSTDSPHLTPIEPPANQQESKQKDVAIDYKFDETTLLSLPNNSVMLQLSGIQNPVVLENYLSDNKLKASTWVYETQRYGGTWYVVLYRQSFDSIDAALTQLSNLPANLKEAQPFAKNISQIQQEISLR